MSICHLRHKLFKAFFMDMHSLSQIWDLIYLYVVSCKNVHLWLNYLTLMLLYACMHPCDRAPSSGEVWVGVNDSDIITACRLALLQCPDTDRSSIVPALRGLPRFPCVRNHPPTCYSRQRPKTMKLYTESLWAAGRVLMKDSVCRENNKRQAPRLWILHTHTLTHTGTHTR